MAKELKFRKLYADEIDCRVGTDNGTGVSLLLYKDARVDMRLLDEVVGAFNWKREHELINGNLFCTVSIYNAETKEWVSKQDVGTESNTEKEKGQASDAFKRACFNWVSVESCTQVLSFGSTPPMQTVTKPVSSRPVLRSRRLPTMAM